MAHNFNFGGQHRTTAVELGNNANAASERGDYPRAIELFERSLELKPTAYGADSLDRAEEVLQKALHVRNDVAFGGLGLGPRNDAAATRDNLGQLYEARSRFEDARAIRLKGATRGETMCGNYNCMTPGGAMMRTGDLKACGACSSVFYCSATSGSRSGNKRLRIDMTEGKQYAAEFCLSINGPSSG
ncbi:hypothetical protein B0H66DRAFT_596784 [Apodospora peruviana]|uniref:Tetratricopeptide repeat protein n=1 Tax=Apodospora peruviana TaxID=516989 RepID=A0AAE0IQD9_9PEZI|nr:hypothetical protein B0H66DRAFT_596784 [Apodospora peruviana]